MRLAGQLQHDLRLESERDAGDAGSRPLKIRVVEAAAVAAAPAGGVERRSGHDDEIELARVDLGMARDRLGDPPGARLQIDLQVVDARGDHALGPDHPRQAEGLPVTQDAAVERGRLDLAAERGEGQYRAGGVELRQTRGASADGLAQASSFRVRQRVAGAEDAASQIAFAGGRVGRSRWALERLDRQLTLSSRALDWQRFKPG